MAASQADRFDIQGGLVEYIPYDVKASEVIYQGIMVMLLASSSGPTTTGDQLIPAADTANGKVVGLSMQSVTGGATDGAVKCNVQPIGSPDAGRYWELDATSPTSENWCGQLAYVLDDHTAALAAGVSNSVLIGRCVRVTKTGTSGRVLIDTMQRT